MQRYRHTSRTLVSFSLNKIVFRRLATSLRNFDNLERKREICNREEEKFNFARACLYVFSFPSLEREIKVIIYIRRLLQCRQTFRNRLRNETRRASRRAALRTARGGGLFEEERAERRARNFAGLERADEDAIKEALRFLVVSGSRCN